MKTIEGTMSIIHQENNHTKINTLEETEISKAASSENLLSDIVGQTPTVNCPSEKTEETSMKMVY
jgi:hypothetical protein